MCLCRCCWGCGLVDVVVTPVLSFFGVVLLVMMPVVLTRRTAGSGGLDRKLRLRGLLGHDWPAQGESLESRRPARDELCLGYRLAVRGNGVEYRVLLELVPVDGLPNG